MPELSRISTGTIFFPLKNANIQDVFSNLPHIAIKLGNQNAASSVTIRKLRIKAFPKKVKCLKSFLGPLDEMKNSTRRNEKTNIGFA